ncbi:amidohydrolase [Propionibacteriaceae bacterium G1746]
MTTTAARAVLAGLDDLRPDLEGLYRELHRNPELSHHEVETAAKVADLLRLADFDVTEGVGGTGVVGILRNGSGPRVLLRADMDALPVKEATGLDYASTATGTGADGKQVPVMHACGHDVHVAALATAANLLARGRDQWQGTLVVVFQPAEEVADGADSMVADGLVDVVGGVDIALAQHVLAMPAGAAYTRAGAVLSAADSLRITVHGRGAHGSMPQAAVDPVVLAAMIVIRLQTVVSRELAPTEPAVLTIGSIHAGSASNVISDHAVIELNLRTYNDQTRTQVLDAIKRIVVAECEASGSPKPPEFEMFDQFPLTFNEDEPTAVVRQAFDDFFGENSRDLPLQSASEDFSDIPEAFGAPYVYWAVGGADPETYAAAEKAGTIASDIPVNHSPFFAPVLQPTLDVATRAMVVGALAWLGTPRG